MRNSSGIGHRALGDVTPRLAQLTDDVLFGDIWGRPELSPRDRSLATVSALIVLNCQQQLPFHLERALGNGISFTELTELVTHLAFYGGWPVAVSAANALKAVSPGAEA